MNETNTKTTVRNLKLKELVMRLEKQCESKFDTYNDLGHLKTVATDIAFLGSGVTQETSQSICIEIDKMVKDDIFNKSQLLSSL